MLAFYSDNQSSNPTEAYRFSVKFVFEKSKNKQKRGWVGQFKRNLHLQLSVCDKEPNGDVRSPDDLYEVKA